MGCYRPRARRLTAREAENLLAGRPPAPDRAGLARLLAAAAAPPRPGELAGERAAVEGFRRAYRPPTDQRRRLAPALRRTALVKLSAVVAVLFLGGTALAAGTGELPAPAQQSAHDLFSPLGVPAPPHDSGTPGVDRPQTGSGPATTPGAAGAPGGGPAVTGTGGASPAGRSPSTDLAQLCRRYLDALAKHEPADPAVRQQLTIAAGDVKRIVQFCTRLLHGGQAPGNDHHDDHTPPPTVMGGT
jgi:hypothetical protein